jgi:cytochrome P450
MFLNKAAEDKTGIFTEKQLIHNCMDLFLAGSETTSKSIQVSVFHAKEQLIHNCLNLFLAGSETTCKSLHLM